MRPVSGLFKAQPEAGRNAGPAYQEPPPPPPEPPPDEPPPEPELDGLDDIAEVADVIAWLIKLPKVAELKDPVPLYQPGGSSEMPSNFFIHLSDTPRT